MDSSLYSVSSSYIALMGNMTKLREVEMFRNAVMLPRQRVITWLAYQDKLMTKERLVRLSIPINGDTNCLMCDQATSETHQHLFVNCIWIKNIREAMIN